jgi:SAM-dependent methyltransferase
MEAFTYQLLQKVEDHHWWYVSRWKLVRAELVSVFPGRRDLRILDIGCGTGGTTKRLEDLGEVIGVDPEPLAVAAARTKVRTAQIIQAPAMEVDTLFAPESFDLITFFHVLYHRNTGPAAEVVAKVARLLKPAGILLATEPAFRMLMRQHDIVDMGKTRYTLKDFKNMFAQRGLVYRNGRYFNSFAFAPCLLSAGMQRLFSANQEKATRLDELKLPAPWLNRLLIGIMGWETRVSRICSPPLGVSLIAIGQKHAR